MKFEFLAAPCDNNLALALEWAYIKKQYFLFSYDQDAPMENYTALLSVFSVDRIGLVSSVAGYLFDKGINLGDTNFAILGKGGEFSSILEIPSDISVDEVLEEMMALSGLKNAKIEIKRTSIQDDDTPATKITHRIKCGGADQPGLLARLSEIFIEFDANIVRLKTDLTMTNNGMHYTTRFAVNIPPARTDNCLAAIGNTAAELGQQFQVEKIS